MMNNIATHRRCKGKGKQGKWENGETVFSYFVTLSLCHFVTSPVFPTSPTSPFYSEIN